MRLKRNNPDNTFLDALSKYSVQREKNRYILQEIEKEFDSAKKELLYKIEELKIVIQNCNIDLQMALVHITVLMRLKRMSSNRNRNFSTVTQGKGSQQI